MKPEIVIETRDLTKKFNMGKSNEVLAVQSANLCILANTCTILKGASGSGKTTLLTVLSGLAKPTSGEYFCLGEGVSRWSEKFLTQFRRKHIGIVFQHFNLIQGFSVFYNIAIPLLPLGISRKKIKQLVETVAEQVNISHRLDFQVDTLSGGEMQRVAIARALVNNPTILFADEPTSHLDSDSSTVILEILNELKKQGKTILLTTHDPRVEVILKIDNTIVMKDGRIIN